jgi:hypothetical protein
VPLAAGRPFTLDEERPGTRAPVAIASYAVWRKTGLSPSFVGSTVRVNGTPVTVVGVTARTFTGTMTLMSPQWWFPLGSYDIIVNEVFKQRTTGLTDRGNYAVNIAGVLKPGVGRVAADQHSMRSPNSWTPSTPAPTTIRRFCSPACRAWASARSRRPNPSWSAFRRC